MQCSPFLHAMQKDPSLPYTNGCPLPIHARSRSKLYRTVTCDKATGALRIRGRPLRKTGENRHPCLYGVVVSNHNLDEPGIRLDFCNRTSCGFWGRERSARLRGKRPAGSCGRFDRGYFFGLAWCG